jgi:hypothetical protein
MEGTSLVGNCTVKLIDLSKVGIIFTNKFKSRQKSALPVCKRLQQYAQRQKTLPILFLGRVSVILQ